MANQFQTGIFDCHKDTTICLYGCCLPCYQAALNKAGVDGRECNIFDCICCPVEYFTRQQVRAKYGIPQDACADCMCLCIFPFCALCQDAREIKLRSAGPPTQGMR